MYPSIVRARFTSVMASRNREEPQSTTIFGFFGRPDGTDLPRKQPHYLAPDEVVDLHLPGGGGYGDPLTRDPERVRQDVAAGYVTPEAAEWEYGVRVRYVGPPDALVRPSAWFELDEPATQRLRQDAPQSTKES